MAGPLVSQNGKLNALNKKIVEVKKTIQLSEGQRKANFEECDAKKRESVERIGKLKKEVKELQLEFAKAKNNNEVVAAKETGLDRESSASVKKRNLEAAIATLDEDNNRLRKKFDLVKYQSEKQRKRLKLLLQEYEELMNGKPGKVGAAKPSTYQIKKKISRLENQLHRVSVMQMEADTVRKKYRQVRTSLKADASFYSSCLDGLEESIREQENEIKRLQNVKTEAIELRDTTKESFGKQEMEASHVSKEREMIIQEYRRRVEDRKLELERLERMIFSSMRPIAPREDSEADPKSQANGINVPQSEIDELEEAFVKLRSATGVSRTEEVLDRFLAQRATKEKLKRMQATTEAEKVALEKKRQQLTAEIEMQKFSETKDADQNAGELERLNKQIEEQKCREKDALSQLDTRNVSLKIVGQKLLTFCDKLNEDNGIVVSDENANTLDVMAILDRLNDRINKLAEKFGGKEKFNELMDQVLSDKVESMSSETISEQTKQTRNVDEQPLFPLFPMVTTPALQPQPSEDEDDIPSRSLLKRQAQLLVDAKSRRKGFAFKR